ncbi:MAG: cyclic nucleotide-binding domain-containing protein [Proteobacteria bacterium]|nr:cyclic nucleotide-binding domain-containing protein [Pseudomonadota bacterium]HQR04768.1 cyclic nucleotide-binding domain-containing protein [Rhodocyclaceae bacterium]
MIARADIAARFSTFESLGDGFRFVDRILEIIDHIHLFEDFDHDEIAILARYMRCFRIRRGLEIIHEGETGDFMLLVLEGRIEIVKVGANGLPARIALAGPGKTLGEMSVIDGEPRFASCIAEEEVTVAVIDRASLSRLIADQPGIGVKLLMEMLMLLNQRLRTITNDLIRCRTEARLRIR